MPDKNDAKNSSKPFATYTPETAPVEDPHLPAFRRKRRDWRGWLQDPLLVNNEKPEEFEFFRKQFRGQLNLAPGFVSALFDHLVISAWRLRRLARAEADIFSYYARQGAGQGKGLGAALIASIEGNHFLQHLSRFEAGQRRHFFKYFKLMLQLQIKHAFPYQPDPLKDPGLNPTDYLPQGYTLPHRESEHVLPPQEKSSPDSALHPAPAVCTTPIAVPSPVPDSEALTTNPRARRLSQIRRN